MSRLGEPARVVRHALEATLVELGLERGHVRIGHRRVAVQTADGRTKPPRHIPPPALRIMANTVGRLRPQLGRQARAALAMDSGDHTFDASALRLRYPDLPTTRLTDSLRVNR